MSVGQVEVRVSVALPDWRFATGYRESKAVAEITAVTFDRSGVLVATAVRPLSGPRARVEVHRRLPDGTKSAGFVDIAGGDVSALAFSPDGRTLAYAVADRAPSQSARIHFWPHGNVWVEPVKMEVPAAEVAEMAFSPDGGMLCTVAKAAGKSVSDSRVLLWDIGLMRMVRQIHGHDGTVFSVTFHPRARMLATGDQGVESGAGRVRLWNSSTGELLWECADHPGGVTTLAFSPDGRRLASGGEDGCIQIWSIPGEHEYGAVPRRLATLTLFDENTSAILLPDGSYKLDGDPGGRLWWSIGLNRIESGEIERIDPSVRRLSVDEPVPGMVDGDFSAAGRL